MAATMDVASLKAKLFRGFADPTRLAILESLRWAGFKGMTYTLPVFIEGSVNIGGVPVDFQRMIVIAIGIVVVTFMWLFTHFNRTGLALRGMAQDEHAAMMLGIDSD